ncbi:MAG: IS6 family transposase [Pleurocapsa sp. MO_226.B13]|nr:IS6 family transposase [Pleurocapsa sp. MO_226.B13]
MVSSQPFKWRHFQSEIILLNVRWYCRYPLSYRNLESMMLERGLEVDHSTINRWILRYGPELDRRCRTYLKPTNDSWRVDETYVKVKKQWKYLYRAVDSEGNTLDFLLTAKRDTNAAKRFLIKALKATHTQEPRVINVDKNPSDPPATEQLKKSSILPEDTELRQVKYLNNMVEQDHRSVKHLINPGMSFGSFNSARRTIKGYEAMSMIRKGQIQDVEKGDVMGQISFINQIFGLAA